MKPRRNARGRYSNPQPALFLGLADDPAQSLIFDATDPDPEPAREWAALFADAPTGILSDEEREQKRRRHTPNLPTREEVEKAQRDALYDAAKATGPNLSPWS